ncbi:hypothetical protein [Salinisphaera sp. Q1T1-3]|uniref:tetratricopeptide repeat protein n=1 Tax=Salinisphaera sp. Q1T1-3 TaxID=2321229 RepID=UPI000E712925|nr:hypothetical protein [Salinisphaera sp. Q1T1-3]RJS92326.1 hypothetical protein D3260_11805 [Salinisphaera sp. Q1T1-3]
MKAIGAGGIAVAALWALSLTGCATDAGVDKPQAAAANANVGAEYLRKNDNERAAQAFQRALHYESDDFTANWGMAVVSDRRNAPADARRYFEKALAARQSPAVYNSFAAFLCKHGDTQAGLANFQKALSAPNVTDRADTLANAGLCLARADQTARAADYFEQALAIDARQPTALTQLADIAYHAQDYMKARAYIERADSATTLDAEQLRLAADIESAMNDRAAAESYLKRYHNANQPAASSSPGQREPSRQ